MISAQYLSGGLQGMSWSLMPSVVMLWFQFSMLCVSQWVLTTSTQGSNTAVRCASFSVQSTCVTTAHCCYAVLSVRQRPWFHWLLCSLGVSFLCSVMISIVTM